MAVTLDFTGQVVFVTGATKGLGRAIAQRFAGCGATIALCARKAVDDLPGDWHFETADLRDAQQATAVVDAVYQRHGRIDVVVNNAGGSPALWAADMSPRMAERLIALNLLAPLYVCLRAYHWMSRQQSGGSIININSITAIRPAPRASAYGAAKAGLANLTQSLAYEWAPKVRVNGIIPGPVLTEMAETYYGEGGVDKMNATIPFGRMVLPSEVADTCLYLSSSLAGFVTGSNVVVHGGGEKLSFIEATEA